MGAARPEFDPFQCRGGTCDLAVCKHEHRCCYKSSAEEAREVKEAVSKLTTDPKLRKALPLVTGVLDYFPDALLAVAHCSKVGNDQHNPGEPLHWARGKSTDESDALGRHLLERGKMDVDGVRHSAKLAWRALALLQKEIEGEAVA